MTDLAVRKQGALAPQRKQNSAWHTPQNMNEGMELAQTIAGSGLVKRGTTPAEVFVKLATGAELGISPMASLRALYNIEGTIGIAASLQVALIRTSSVCEQWDVLETSATRCVLRVCRVGGRPLDIVWDKDRAEKSGLWGKAGPWSSSPHRMLMRRAESEAAIALFQDVLWGMDSVDVLRDEVTLAEEALPQPAAPPAPSAPPVHEMLAAPAPSAPPADVAEQVAPPPAPAQASAESIAAQRDAAAGPRRAAAAPADVREQMVKALASAIPKLGGSLARRLVAAGCTDVASTAIFVRDHGRMQGMRTAAYEWLLEQLPADDPETATESWLSRLAGCESRKEMVGMAEMMLAQERGDGDITAAAAEIKEGLKEFRIEEFPRAELAELLDEILAELTGE